MKKIFAIFFFFFFLSVSAQQDYEWLKIKKYKVSILSDSLKETSGLTFFKDKLYTFNDGGNTSEIFEIDKYSGKILNKIKIHIENKDWEAITSDSSHIYIGDFGNNYGMRKDLKIYKIKFDSIDDSQEFQQTLNFYYPEQQNFSQKPHNNNWDMESMVFIDKKIHLFTKEWASKKTNHYIIDPNISENQPAERLETFDIGYLVTDASLFDKKLYVVGYTKQLKVYLSIFELDENGMFFSRKPKSFILGSSLKVGQIEGIAVNKDGIFISGEKFKTPLGNVPPKLYHIPTNKIPR